ncbi:LysM peptidoglycan-binding domain-containing protein [Paenibacillus xerothermodurans]|nr:LysM domain-containing protein [Paenibacillus xerothermodurans]
MYRPINACPWPPYTVQPGDTVLLLVDKFKVYWRDILWWNPSIANISTIVVGQQLCIPRGICPPGSFSYTVKPGDTLYQLALYFEVPLARLQQANPRINPNLLQVGQVICIPDSTPYKGYPFPRHARGAYCWPAPVWG